MVFIYRCFIAGLCDFTITFYLYIFLSMDFLSEINYMYVCMLFQGREFLPQQFYNAHFVVYLSFCRHSLYTGKTTNQNRTDPEKQRVKHYTVVYLNSKNNTSHGPSISDMSPAWLHFSSSLHRERPSTNYCLLTIYTLTTICKLSSERTAVSVPDCTSSEADN